MERRLSLSVGVIVAREDSDNQWQDHVWRVAGVVIGADPQDTWREIDRGPGVVHYFAGTRELEVFRKETEAYQVNLENKVPVVYVVMRENDDFDGPPLDLHLVTVSAYEAQDYLDTGEEIVDTVPMPEPLIAWVQRYVDRNHVEEKFVKRKRDDVRIEDHKFGQEPIFVRNARDKAQDH